MGNPKDHLTQLSYIPEEETEVQSGCDSSRFLCAEVRPVPRYSLFPLTPADATVIHFAFKKNLTTTLLTVGVEHLKRKEEKKTPIPITREQFLLRKSHEVCDAAETPRCPPPDKCGLFGWLCGCLAVTKLLHIAGGGCLDI